MTDRPLRLILLRHGETEENRSGILQGHLPGKLTDVGLAQADAVAKRLQIEKLDRIYCSDLQRAKDTAERLLKFHPSITPSYSSKIRERALGIFEGQPGHNYYEAFEKSPETRIHFKPHGGESIKELQQRTDEFIQQECLQREHFGQTVLVVTHGGVIVTILATLLDATLEEMLAQRCGNTAVSILEISRNRQVSVPVFNCVEHLKV